jgi:glycine/D-amino acid oxidase-like deaminating enzyme
MTLPNSKMKDNTNDSYWRGFSSSVQFPSVTENMKVDVVITGSGAAGVMIAYNLLRTGKKVALIAETDIFSIKGGRSNSHLQTAIDARYYNLERIYGEEKNRFIAESRKCAINFIERTVLDLNIDCEFERLDGFLFLHPEDKTSSLSNELKAAQKAGVSVTDLPFVLGTNKHVPCLKFHEQAQFHPLKYIKALCEEVIRLGGAIYENTEIASINDDSVTTTGKHIIKADHIVCTSGTGLNDQSKGKQYCSYSIAAKVKKNSVRKFLWWDSGNPKTNSKHRPYHHVRIQNHDQEHDLLICSGENHLLEDNRSKLSAQDRYAMLESWARERFPVQDVIWQWKEEGMEPRNRIGYIGKKNGSKNIYTIAGDAGSEMMNAAIGALIIPDLITEKNNAWAKLYDPCFALPTKAEIISKEILKGTAGYVKRVFQNLKSMKRNYQVNAERQGEQAPRAMTTTSEVVGTEGVLQDGNIYWNNDEESWDRIHQQRSILYGHKNL